LYLQKKKKPVQDLRLPKPKRKKPPTSLAKKKVAPNPAVAKLSTKLAPQDVPKASPAVEKATQHLSAGTQEFILELTDWLSAKKMKLCDLFKSKVVNTSRDGEEITVETWKLRSLVGRLKAGGIER
jgi:hypothetical protein